MSYSALPKGQATSTAQALKTQLLNALAQYEADRRADLTQTLAGAEQRVGQLKACSDSMKSKLQGERDTASQELVDAQLAVSQYTAQKNALQTKINTAESNVASKEKQHEAVHAELVEWVRNNDLWVGDQSVPITLDAEARSLKKQIDKLEKQIKNLKTQLNQLKQQLSQAISDRDEVETKIDRLADRIATLASTVVSYSEMSVAIADAGGDLDSMRSLRRSLENTVTIVLSGGVSHSSPFSEAIVLMAQDYDSTI